MQKPVVSLSVSLAVAALCGAKRGGSLNLALLWGISSLATTQALLTLRSKLFPSKEKSLLDVLNGGVCKGDLAKDVFRDAPAPTPPEYPKIPPHKVKPSTPSFDFGTDQGCAQGLAYLEEHGYVVARYRCSVVVQLWQLFSSSSSSETCFKRQQRIIVVVTFQGGSERGRGGGGERSLLEVGRGGAGAAVGGASGVRSKVPPAQWGG